jgi:hypothetical protein
MAWYYTVLESSCVTSELSSLGHGIPRSSSSSNENAASFNMGTVPASDVAQSVLQVTQRDDLHQLRFELAEVTLATLGGVDAKGEDAKPIAESPALPNGVDGVVQVANHILMGSASILQRSKQCCPGPLEAGLRRRT